MADPLPVSPSAERNKGPILEVLAGLLPATGAVLELASGSGQHVVHFAVALPALDWQPSEPDAARRAMIAARIAASGLANIRPPLALDVLADSWPVGGTWQAVIAINLIHIAPWAVTAALFRGAARVLDRAPSAAVVLYGPYTEGGRHTAESNAAFDARLRAEDPSWGVRDLAAVGQVAGGQGFIHRRTVTMPANNRLLVFGRDAPPGP